jgi:hypothetical protein
MKIFVNQAFGLGDILFLSPLVKEIEKDDNIEEVYWKIKDVFYWVKDYLEFDKVTFIKESDMGYPFEAYLAINFEHSVHIVEGRDCMETKYNLVNAPLEIWRNISLKRNYKKEEELLQKLNIKKGDDFIFVNNNFGNPSLKYSTDINPNVDCRIVPLEYVKGFTLIDWCSVLEQAKEIHSVSTSLYFVIEAIGRTHGLHLYPRKPFDKDFTPIISLLHPKWQLHE